MNDDILITVAVIRENRTLGVYEDRMPAGTEPHLLQVAVMEAARQAGIDAQRVLLSERSKA